MSTSKSEVNKVNQKKDLLVSNEVIQIYELLSIIFLLDLLYNNLEFQLNLDKEMVFSFDLHSASILCVNAARIGV